MVSLQSLRQVPDFLPEADWTRERFRQEAVYIEVAGVPEILGPP